MSRSRNHPPSRKTPQSNADARSSQNESHEVTLLLRRWRDGDEGAVERLLPIVYEELRGLARGYLKGEHRGHTLQPTALVHEAYLRLLGAASPPWHDRVHFFAVAARQMRRILVDHARGLATKKRGGAAVWVTLDEERVEDLGHRALEVLSLEEALAALEEIDERKMRIVEMRYFAGMTLEEVARALDLSVSTVNNETRFARAWLRHRLESRE